MTVWIIGKIINTAAELNGEPLKMIGIQIKPLTTTGETDTKAIIGGKSYSIIHPYPKTNTLNFLM